MKRIKVINEPTELVPMLRAVATPVRRDVFKDVSEDWRTMKQIEEKYGPEGREALFFFEKMKLVETRWQSSENAQPAKAYHSYYMSFHINTSSPITEISDVLYAAVMDDKEFEDIEKKILEMVGKEGKFTGDLAEALKISPVMLKGIVKRSSKLEFKGHRVEAVKIE